MDLVLYPVILAAILLPGLVWGRRWPSFEGIGLSAAGGVMGWGAVALGRFFLRAPAGAPRSIGLAALVAALLVVAVLWHQTRPGSVATPAQRPDGRLLSAVGAAALLTLGLEAAVPHFGIAQWSFDWWMHFDLSRFYLSGVDPARSYADGYTVTSRTPLFNLLGSLALGLGDRFSMLQVLTAAIGWLWILPYSVLARRLCARAAVPMVCLAALSPMILYSHAYTWPKGLEAFLLLMALERFLHRPQALAGTRNRTDLQFGLLAGGAVLAHAGFVGYLVPLFVILGVRARRTRQWTGAALAVIGAIVVVGPWYAWAVSQYGWHQGLLAYPPAQSSPTSFIIQRVVILLTSLLPVTFPLDWLAGALDPAANYFLTYLGTAAGLGGVGFLIFALAALWHRRADRAWLGTPSAWFAVSGMVVGTLLVRQFAIDSAGSMFVPAILVLALHAVGGRQLPAVLIRIAVAELVIFEVVALTWIWSAAAMTQRNAQQALLYHTDFLGQRTWPVGLALMTAGGLICLRLLMLSAAHDRAQAHAGAYLAPAAER